ncbi:MAG: LptF/LptG family permease, partial [Victivallales bacterium]|nr:LptF/LptG family permease [Victivallales bacterium]
ETVFPFATFLGVSFMTIVKGKNSELTAIRAAGLSLLVTALPVWLLCLFLCGAEMYLLEVVKPMATRYTEQVRLELEQHKQAKKRLDAKVKSEFERRLREQYGEETATIPRNERKALEREVRERFSQAELKHADRNQSRQKTNGLFYCNAQNHTEWQFADFHTDAPCHGVVVWTTDEDGRLLSRRLAHQAFYDESARIWHFQGGETVQFEYHAPDALPHPATQVRHAENEITAMPYTETPQEIDLLHHQPDELNLGGLLQMLRLAEYLPETRQRFVRTMVAYRLFYPLSTLVAGLLGFALTITQGRKSAITGFVVAAVLLMVYYSVAQQAVVLGRSGTLPALLAGALPTLLALAGSLFLAWKRQ